MLRWAKVADPIGLRGYRVTVPGRPPLVVTGTTASLLRIARARGRPFPSPRSIARATSARGYRARPLAVPDYEASTRRRRTPGTRSRSTASRCARSATSTVDALVDWLSDDAPAAAPARDAGGDGGAARRARPERRVFDDALADALRGRPAVREPLRAPALLRLRPVRRHVARRARRLRRERVQRLRGLVAGVGGADAARARGARLVQGLDRLPGRGGGLARHRRLGREPDRDRLRARGARRGDARRPRRLRLRPGALLDRSRGARCSASGPTSCACCRSTTSCASSPATLAAAIDADEAAGRLPFLVVANGGATSTGAIDPLDDLAALCRERGVWLHVDAAYGGFAVLTERGRPRSAGSRCADSVTLDPHKWLYQPYECGCLLVRDGRRSGARSRCSSDYLRDAEVDERRGELRRLWAAALALVARASSCGCRCARSASTPSARRSTVRSTSRSSRARRIEASERLELVAPPSLGIVCFRRTRLDDDELTDGLVAALEQSGLGFISSTRVHGRAALRLCILNHTSTAEDVERVLAFLETAEPAAGAPRTTEHEPRLQRRPALRPARARTKRRVRVALVQRASQPARRSSSAGRRAASSSCSRRALVDVARRRRASSRRFEPGDYFGEIAALEWGAGFARARSATVVARDDVRLRVLDPDALPQLLAAVPAPRVASSGCTAHERLRRAR